MAINKTVIKHNSLAGFLKTAREKELPGLFLIFGESFLIKQALKILKDFLLGKEHDSFAVEILEGGSTSIGDLIEQVATFSFLAPKKVVQVNHMALFSPAKGGADINYTPLDLDHLAGFMETGIPENHRLIMTAPLC